MIMKTLPPRREWLQLARYYVAGVINLGFGYLLFAAMVWLGLQVYVAQAVGHVLGVIFNYFTYDRIAFTDKYGSKIPFIISYVLNYVVGVSLLWLGLRFIASPYGAGFAAAVILSILNYFVLSKWVFRSPAKTAEGL